jgi:hypothetical protein
MRQALERDGVCLWGLRAKDGCSAGLDPHHIVFKGAGGNDEVENLISLCRKHHDEAQARKIAAASLQGLLTYFYGYTYEAK